jgi:hypothetical protein
METLVHSYADADINTQLTKEDKIRFLRDMFRIRRFEQTSLKYYNLGKMGGFLHLYSGQEAVAVGTISLLGENDHFITAYRDHGHALAVGMDMKPCMAELFGKATGCSKGKGGSMHFFAPEKNYWGGHGIVGGQTPIGVGIAFALKYKALPGCCLCYLGDGAINQGSFHECLNLASLFKLPVIYIIENNGYSMGTSQQRSSAFRDSLAKRAEAYNMAWDVFNGKIFTRSAPEPRSRLIVPIMSPNRRSSRSKLTATTGTRSLTPTPKNIGRRKKLNGIKHGTTRSASGRRCCSTRDSSPKTKSKKSIEKQKRRPTPLYNTLKRVHSRTRATF